MWLWNCCKELESYKWFQEINVLWWAAFYTMHKLVSQISETA